jgi:hypothetical protein
VNSGRLVLVLVLLAALAWPAGGLQAQEKGKSQGKREAAPPVQVLVGGQKSDKQPPPPPPAPAIKLLESEVKLHMVQAAELRALNDLLVLQAAQRFHFKIDPKAPVNELLPVPPGAGPSGRPLLGDDLSGVSEVAFEAPPGKNGNTTETARQIAHQIAKINHLNQKQTDGFLEALRDRRADLRGLAFAMGDACRTTGERSKQFNRAVATVRNALQPPLPANKDGTKGTLLMEEARGSFWERYQAACRQEDKNLARADQVLCEHVTLARIAALMQMLAPEAPELRRGLVKYLASISHAEATRALARLAIFTAEDEVRRAAVDALKVRRERDYTEVLKNGLHYPYPAVARRAADAIAKLERKDLLPQLVALLEEPDPRAPILQNVGRREVPVVRELVRVNHHRNCLLCHAPGNTGTVAPDTLTAGVPIPGESLAPPSRGYQTSFPDATVRLDVTYLRQDFSLLQPVADAHPWPEMQRFDFLVRDRTLTEEEAAAYREQLEPREKGRLSPYRRVALAALRELTGLEAAPTAEAWRRLLKLPAR